MDPNPDELDTSGEDIEDTSGEFDTAAALAEISSDLFGREADDTGGEPEVAAEEVTPPEQSPPSQPEEGSGDENSAEVQDTGAPKTWSKEALETWATVPDRAKQEILKREEDMFRGIEQYREKADLGTQYDTVVEPYRAALQAEGVNPIELFQNFAGNHYLLSRGTPDQKLQIATNLINHYGIDRTGLFEALFNAPEKPQVDPYVKQLEDRLRNLEGGVQQQTQAQQEAKVAELRSQVETFAADPANAYFPEVAENISALLKGGVAQTLKEAYDMAVWNNPITRAKEVDRLAAEKATQATEAERARVAEARKSQAANVRSSTKSRDGTVPLGSIDDTLKEAYAAIQARG